MVGCATSKCAADHKAFVEGNYMKVYTITILIVVWLIAGCAYNVQVYSKLDLSNKTMTIPAGGAGLIGALKSALTEEGWDLAVYRGPRITEGTLGEKTRLEEYGTFNTRYALFVDYKQYDVRFPDFEPMYTFDISIIDNNTGKEVLTMSGQGVRSTIVTKFLGALRSNS